MVGRLSEGREEAPLDSVDSCWVLCWLGGAGAVWELSSVAGSCSVGVFGESGGVAEGEAAVVLG